jgi:uncharacterized membrane protein YidH (DUF202 family)
MRWLMIGLLISLGGLLLAVAGMARHIRNHRETQGGEHRPPGSAHGSDLEPEP